ncbi:hypothetical protein [Methanolobus sp. WCC4]|uniref:hypothetical protein n=1 Tax=Methanolobus sp. WCC4 TaxID=3125784 RepID=UPI0030F71D49
MEKGVSYGLLIIVVAVLIGLSGNIWSCGPVPVEGLLIVDGSSSIGSSDDNGSVSIYSYEFTLLNSGGKDIYVTTVEPVLAESPYIITSQASVLQKMNSYVEAGSSLKVEGIIELDTGDVPKEEIMDLKPILYVNVSSTEVLPYFAY